MIEKFINHIKDKDLYYTIFDIGSRDCLQSIEFYHAFPNAKIYAFECNPNTIPICRKNIYPYSNRISLFDCAITDYDGEIVFYPINQHKTRTSWKDGNPGASSIFKSNGMYPMERYVQDEIVVPCHRLDTIINQYQINTPDIIWIDLQGAELLAFKSLGNYISDVKYIYTEVSHRPIYEGQVLFDELNSFLYNHQFIHNTKINIGAWQDNVIYYRA